MLTNYAAAPVWPKSKCLIIPDGTADVDYWMSTTVGGSDSNAAAALAGTGLYWSVQGVHINLESDISSGTAVITIYSMDTDKTTPLEAIEIHVKNAGTYVVPVFWRATDADKYLRLDYNGDAAATAYVRAFGVVAVTG